MDRGMIEIILKGEEAEKYLTFRNEVRNAMNGVIKALDDLEETTPSNLSLSYRHWEARGVMRAKLAHLAQALEN